MRYIISLFLLFTVLIFTGCATHGSGSADQHADKFENYNRKMHNFNSGLYRRVLHPVGKAVDTVTPDILLDGLDAILVNLEVPNTAFNNLLQGKPKAAGQDISRFVVNTTLGIAGLIDWASMWGIPEHEEDFGQTLGMYGMAPGSYIVLPVLGGITPRDFFGGLVSIDPTYALKGDALLAYEGTGIITGLAGASDMEELPSYQDEREMFYAFRHCSVQDGAVAASQSCMKVCEQFEVMLEEELEAISSEPDHPDRLQMLEEADEFMPAYCKL